MNYNEHTENEYIEENNIKNEIAIGVVYVESIEINGILYNNTEYKK